MKKLFLMFCVGLSLVSCTLKPDYLDPTMKENPPKILVVLPPENQTSNTEVEEKLYPIISVEMAKRGYYVISPEMVRAVFNQNKLQDAGQINALSAEKIASVFHADAILKTRVYDWSSAYYVLSASINVGLDMEVVDAKTGKQLWAFKRLLSQAPEGSDSLIGALVNAAMTAATTPYEPIARQNAATMFSTVPAGQDLKTWGVGSK